MCNSLLEESSTSSNETDTEQEQHLYSSKSPTEVVQLVVRTCQDEHAAEVDQLNRQMQDLKQENLALKAEEGRRAFLEDKQKRSDKAFRFSRELTRKVNPQEPSKLTLF